MEKLLSIVIPSYNVEQFLGECLDSLIKSQKLDVLDIIIVNDGSKDLTGKIALNYQEKYPDSINVINKENGGHGSTINVGITKARGKYFKIIDGDDWVDEKALDSLLNYLTISDSDLILSNYNKVFPNETIEIVANEGNKYDFNKIYSIQDILEVNNHIFEMAALTIKTSLVKNKYHIDENTFYVDVEFVLYSINYVNTISFTSDNVYQYRLGNQNQSMDISNVIKNINHHQRVIRSILNFIFSDMADLNKKNFYLHKVVSLIYFETNLCLNYAVTKEYLEKTILLHKEIKNQYPEVFELLAQSKLEKLFMIFGYSFMNTKRFIFSRRKV